MEKSKQVIGRHDKVDLPRLGLYDIDAKVDTGAYTSAIHCSQIELLEVNGKPKISFHILDARHTELSHRTFVTGNFRVKNIKSSFGQVEKRYIIKTKIVIFGRKIKTEFSLSDRESMRFPILLGRRLLRNKFIVDVTKCNLSHTQKQIVVHK
jgi:hypothetical protein